MKKYTKIEVPARITSKHTSTVCDLCGDETADSWRKGAFDAGETTVEVVAGTRYPEGGSGTKIEYDICPKCFMDKLIPWLESQGAKTDIQEWGW
jgi:hypothetical protein